jgi:signal transduction histidine kinase/ActR/RegA family two-component response regulator
MPSGAHTMQDPKVLREPLARVVGEQMPSVLGGIGALAGICALVDLASLPPQASSIVLFDLFTCLASFAARLAWIRFAILRRFIHPIGALFGLLFAANTIATMALTGEMAYSSHLAVMLIGAGAFFVSFPWLVAYDVVIFTAWYVVARRVATPAEQWAHAFALALSAALAALLLATRVRAYAKIALLRARDRVRGERLRAALARSRNELEQRQRAEVEEKRLREQLLQARKMDAVGRLAGGVAHEINNALASILTVTGLLLEEDRLDTVAREDLRSIRMASERAADLTRKLLAVGRKGKYSTSVLDPGEIVDRARQSLADKFPQEIEVVVELAHGDALLEGDAEQLFEALRNLLVNAIDAMPDGGMLSIRTSRVSLDGAEAHGRAVAPGDYVAITVQDSGVGMDSETRKLAFDPFFTTKAVGEGTGLGLPMVYGTARNHGGSAEIESAPGKGTRVTLHVPCATLKESLAPPSGSRRDVRGRSLLLVDDEPTVRAAARRILERMGLRVREAENGRRALEVYASDGPFDLVVVDMVMPLMAGRELFFRLREKAPDARVLLVSGFAPDDDAQALLEAGALGFLEKPYTLAALTRAVRTALASEPPAAATEA